MSIYTVLAAGETALEIIHQEKNASVMGVTSRGVFLFTPNAQVFFLSYETWRGPLTINLDWGTGDSDAATYPRKEQRSHPQHFDRLTHGSLATILPDRMRFDREDLTLVTTSVSGWTASIQPIQADSLMHARHRLEKIARIVLDEGSGKGWIGLIPRWAGFEHIQETEDALLDIEADLQNLANCLHARNGYEILLNSARLLGRGFGLTPSGDDFVIGLLLGLKATAEISPIYQAVNEISQDLIQLARHKTTTLAANMIECALQGQADERLVSALEGILWKSLPDEECARRLIDYGGSSGGDTLLGMAMALHLE